MNLSIICGGIEYSLDDGTLCVLSGHDGWGMMPQHRLSQRGAQQHGESDLGWRGDPRYGTLVLKLPETDLDAMYTARRAPLLRLFAPQNSPTLKWDLGSYVRYIDCHYVGDMSLPWEQEKWAAQTVTVRLKAPDPTFYALPAKSVVFALSGATNSLQVPLSVPMFVGQSTLDQTVSITYAGDVDSSPHRIRIMGPVTDPVITQKTTDEVLDFTGVTIAAGEYYDIDCRYGHKSVVDDSDANKIADLTDDSDLATFHLAAAVEGTASRVNDIQVTGSAVTSATEVYLNYYERSSGI